MSHFEQINWLLSALKAEFLQMGVNPNINFVVSPLEMDRLKYHAVHRMDMFAIQVGEVKAQIGGSPIIVDVNKKEKS